MKNVFNKRRILTLILSLFILLGLAFGFSSNNKVEASVNISYLEDFYQLTFVDNKLELLFSPDIFEYEQLTEDDITTLRDRFVDTLKEAIKDSVKDNYNYTDVSRKTKNTGGFKKLAFRLTLTPYDEIDISTLTNVVKLQLMNNVENIDNFLNGTMYDTMVNYYIDNYVDKFVSEHDGTNANDALDEINDQLYAATQFAIDTTYANLGVPAPDSAAKVQSLIDAVKATKAVDEKIEVTLSDVTDMMTIIEDSNTIINVITELDVDDDVQTVINTATAEDIVDFLTTVDVETIVDVVTNTEIMESTDLENILTNMETEDLVTIAESLNVEGIIEVAKAAGVTSDTLSTILEDKFSEVDLTDIFRVINTIELDGTTIYKNGGFDFDGIFTILKGLPKLSEIANFSDDEMRLQYQLALNTNFGNMNIDFTIGFFGDCSKVRKFASLLADNIQFSKNGSTYALKIDAPNALSDLIGKAISGDTLSDELKQRLLNDSTLSVTELYELIQATSREEYIELLKQVDYENIFKYFLDAENVNAKLGTDLTNDQIDKIVDKMLKLADGGTSSSGITLTRLVSIFADYVDVSSIPTEKFDKLLSKPLAFIKDLVDDNLTAETLRTYVDEDTLTNKINANLDNYDVAGEKFNTFKSHLTKIYNKLPEGVKDIKLVDIYEGEGVFHYSESGNLKELVRKLLPDKYESNALIKKFIDKIPTSATVDFTLAVPGLHKVVFNYGEDTKTLFLPSGQNIAFCSGVDKIGEYDIVSWVDADKNEVELTGNEDIEVTAISDFALAVSENVTATYDPNTDYDLTVTASPDTFAYTYQWYKGETLLEGKTAATLKVKDVADSGTYKCKVNNGYFDKESDAITVTINKAPIDLSNLTWDNEEFIYDGDSKKVLITNLPDKVEVAYTDNEKTAAGSYTATATFTLKAEFAANYELSSPSATKAWKINKAALDLSGLTWDYTVPFTYDKTEKKVLITNLPDKVEVAYTDNAKTAAGTYTAKATFTLKAEFAPNYELSKASDTKEWKINKATLDLSALQWNYTEDFEYDGTEKKVELVNVPEEVSVAYTDNAKTEAGTYTAKATFTLKADYAANYDLSTTSLDLTWKIKQAATPEKIQIDVSGISWDYTTPFEYDGNEKTVALKNVPDHVEVEYSGEYKKSAVGVYNATATLSPKSDEYELVGTTTLTLSWEIKEATSQKQKEFNYGDKVVVTSAEGLDVDFDLSVQELEDFDRDIKAALDRYENGRTRLAYEIHFVKAGSKVDVDGEFTVKIKLPADLKLLKIKLIHFTDDTDDSSAKAVDYEIDGDYIVFTTDGFSDFAIAEVKTAPHIPLICWIILAVLFVIIIILLIFLLKKKKEYPAPVAEPFEQTYFIQLVNADDDTKVRYEELKNSILEKKKDDESFTSVIDEIHEGFGENPEIITLTMVDGVLYAKVKDETFELSSDSELKDCIKACNEALDAAPEDNPPTDETPTEEAKDEAPASEDAEDEDAEDEEDAAEETSEEAPASGEEAEEDVDKVEVVDEETGETVIIRYNKSLEAKMALTTSENKDYYTELMSHILSYGVKYRKSWAVDSYYQGRNTMIKVTMRGKTLIMYIALDPSKVDAKYRVKDVSESKKFNTTPTQVKIKSSRGLKYAKELVDQYFASQGMQQVEEPKKIKSPKTQTLNKLIAAGLVKESKQVIKAAPKEETPAEEEKPVEEQANEAVQEPVNEEQVQEAEKEAPVEEEPAQENEEQDQATEEPAQEATEEAPAEEDEGQEVSAEELAQDGATDDEPTEEGEETEEELAAEDAEAKEKKQKTIYHVSKRDNNGREWKVFKQGSKKVIKLFETQKEALDYAKQLARNKDDGSYVLLHGLDGKIRKY